MLIVVGCRGEQRAAEPPAPGWLAAQIKAFQDSANAPEFVASYRYQSNEKILWRRPPAAPASDSHM